MRRRWFLIPLAYIAGLIIGILVWHVIAQLIGAVDLISMLQEVLW